jgi:hypothetical protein
VKTNTFGVKNLKKIKKKEHNPLVDISMKIINNITPTDLGPLKKGVTIKNYKLINGFINVQHLFINPLKPPR